MKKKVEFFHFVIALKHEHLIIVRNHIQVSKHFLKKGWFCYKKILYPI